MDDATGGREPPPKKPRKEGVAPAHGEWVDRPVIAPADEKANPFAKRKVALLLAYNGIGFSGLQKNPDVTTVEETLEGAIHRAGGISAENFGTLQKVSWSRAGRTDKGVHALGQIISAKLVVSPDGLLERINEQLAGHAISVLGMERVTNNFCAHTLCSSREYEYVLPVHVLRPGCTASVAAATAPPAVASGSGEDVDAGGGSGSSGGAGGGGGGGAGASGSGAPPDASDAVGSAGGADGGLSDADQARLAALLRTYEGTHSFHNFTDGKLTPADKSATRYMMRFFLGAPLELDGVSYVSLRFHGQSFLLHQIRKMVAMVCATFRGDVAPDAIKTALKATRVAPVPMAPSCALFLRRCEYASYERKRTPDRGCVHFPDCDGAQQAFLVERVLPHIAKCEADGEFAKFVAQLSAYTMELREEGGGGSGSGRARGAAAATAGDAGTSEVVVATGDTATASVASAPGDSK